MIITDFNIQSISYLFSFIDRVQSSSRRLDIAKKQHPNLIGVLFLVTRTRIELVLPP